ncbi:flagellar hook-associated protein FlgL [Clostridium sp. Marseille-QA1073]
MRITDRMLSDSFLNDMYVNLNNMKKIQEQRTSGKAFRRPSDDPFAVSRSMQIYGQIYANKQYNSNIKDTINWLDTTDTALNQATKALDRVRELMVSVGDAAYGSEEHRAIKDEINEKISELSQIMNTSFDGKYIFGGTRGDKKPTEAEVDANGNTQLKLTNKDDNELKQIDEKLKVEISQGVIIEYNVSATEIFNFKHKYTDNTGNEQVEALDLKTLFEDITNHLDSKDDLGIVINEDLAKMDSAISNFLTVRSKVGTLQNRMESAQDLNKEQNMNLTEILSHNEDVDVVEKSIEYATMLTVYMSALQTSAQILQPSLIDYLR